jgi:hypothetical protein
MKAKLAPEKPHLRRLLALALAGIAAVAAIGAVELDRPDSQRATPESERAQTRVRPFAPDSVWNAPLRRNAKLASRSAAYVRDLVRQVRRYGAGLNSSEHSTPVYTVPANQPRVRVQLDQYNPALQSALDRVPIPRGARPAAGSDRHLVVWQPATDTMWELWKANEAADGWHAEYGGRLRRASRNPGYYTTPHQRWGATATSLPLLGGLIRLNELKARQIRHALAMAIPEPGQGFVPPAQRGDGERRSPLAMPEGTRLRLPATLNLARLRLTPIGRKIARAAQRYGIIVRDRAGSVVFYGEESPRTGRDPYDGLSGDRALAGFPWRRLQVLAPPTRSRR